MKDYVAALHRAVERFKKYQKAVFPKMTEENDNGEWVFGNRFDDMCNAYLGVIKGVLSCNATNELIDDMLYTIARDSECSHLMVDTLEHPDWFGILCEHCIKSDYYNAKWQFAEQLRDYKGTEEIRKLIFVFMESGDEYTERMALQSLAEMYPDRVEEYAVKFWNRKIYVADEYQKMMALYALEKIGSFLLEKYLNEAEEMDYQYLKNYAAKLREK